MLRLFVLSGTFLGGVSCKPASLVDLWDLEARRSELWLTKMGTRVEFSWLGVRHGHGTVTCDIDSQIGGYPVTDVMVATGSGGDLKMPT